jgi:hypothetical protein
MSNGEPGRMQEVLAASIVRILRPLVRILLRHGIPFGAFADLAKRVYVELASTEFRIGRRKQSVSRIAVITGLTRKDVRRVVEWPAASAAEEAERYNRAARVVTGWTSDPRFQDEDGEPKALLPDPEFAQLVRCFSGDMPARSILDELLRVGAVERGEDGRMRLLARAYVPPGADPGLLEILGTDVAALAATLDHNMTCAPGTTWFQRKVLYDNLPEESLPQLRKLVAGQGQELLERLNVEMRLHDRDCNPEAVGTGRRTAMVGVYWYECETPDDSKGEES